jgi:hypothetical protein
VKKSAYRENASKWMKNSAWKSKRKSRKCKSFNRQTLI